MNLLKIRTNNIRSLLGGLQVGAGLSNKFIARMRATRRKDIGGQILIEQLIWIQRRRIARQQYQLALPPVRLHPLFQEPTLVSRVAVSNDHDLPCRIADQTIQKVDHDRLCEAAMEDAEPHLAQVVHRRNDIAAESIARAANNGCSAARRVTTADQMITSQTCLIFPVNLGVFPLRPSSKRRILELEPVANPFIIALVSARDRFLWCKSPVTQKAANHP